jgi:hypothetical protein
MLDLVKLKPTVRLSNKELIGTLRRGKTGMFLFLFNYHDVDHVTRVEIKWPGAKDALKIPVGAQITIPRRTGRILPIQVSLDSERVLLYTLGEVLAIHREGSHLELELAGCGNLELKMKTPKPKEVRVGSHAIASQYEKGILAIHTQFPAEKTTLELIF